MSMIAAASLALAMVQAPTADEIACVLQTATEADRTQIYEGMRSGSIPDSAANRVGAQAHVCAERFGWNDARGMAMTAVGMASVGRERLSGLLRSRNIDTNVSDRWFERQSEDLRTTPEITQERGETIVRGLSGEGISMERLSGEDGVTVGNYIATLIIFERVRLGLPLQ